MTESFDFILAAEVSRISLLHPFDRMPAERLKSVLRNARIVFFRGGSVILHPEVADSSPRFWLVREGRVRSTPPENEVVALEQSPMQVGAVFPVETVLGHRTTYTYAAEEDCYLWEFDQSLSSEWMAEPALARWIAELLHDATTRLRHAVSDQARARQQTDQALALPIRSFGSSALVCVSPQDSARRAAELMRDRNVGSVLVGTPQAPTGILTQGDLVIRCLAEGRDLATPVSEVMTPSPASIEDHATVFEAGITMGQRHFRRLLVSNERDGIVGIVSERDLFRAQQNGLTSVFRPIDEATTVSEVIAAASRARDFEHRVFANGLEVGHFMRLVSSLNDRVAKRLLAILSDGAVSQTEFCWLAFGSEAREEQGFVTDQDNGMVFVAPPSADLSVVREQMLDFARAATEALDACGFARCKGNIMASNPDLCLTLDEWKDRFSSWIRATTPKALLSATIFFDMRPIHGDSWLAEAMHDHMLAEAKGNTIFFHQLAVNALEVSPPLGKLSRFLTQGGPHGGTIDLKTQGSRLFVDAARIYALQSGIRSANTKTRLRIAGQRIKRSTESIEGDVAAFNFIQSVRLARHLDSLTHGGDPNRVNPYALDELRQRILRESLRQAGNLQDRLRLDFRP